MNKHISLLLVVVAALALSACVPAGALAPAPVATAVSAAPTVAAAVAPTETAAPAAAEPAAGTNPVPPPPADGSRPLASVPPAERANRFDSAAAPYAKPDTTYTATIVTDKGNIVAELYNDTPESLNNFVTLALNGFYDGLTFHRVEPGFVIQGGDPAGDGTGGPGFTIPGEFPHKHTKGALAWARTGDEVNPERRSSGSQFYVTLEETPFLDGAYSVFGQVTEGMDVVGQIAIGDKIQRIDITEGGPSKLPTPEPTAEPRAPTSMEGRPLAAVAVAEREGYYNRPPETNLDTSKAYQATIKTSKGDIVIDLNDDKAAATVGNLKLLADLGYFDGMPVSYVEPGTYALFGSPGAKPSSDVGYLLPAEPGAASSEIVTGTVAMYPVQDPEAGDMKASGSQFFVAMSQLPMAEGSTLSVLGAVSKGLDVIGKLAAGDAVESIIVTSK